jgi:hypothetical protein
LLFQIQQGVAGQKAQALSSLNGPQTDQRKLAALKAAGNQAAHDLGCVANAAGGMIPFAGHLFGNPGTPLDSAATATGAIDEARILASQSDRIGSGLSSIEMPNLGEAAQSLATKAGPIVDAAAEKLGPVGLAIGTANAMMQANACINKGPR